MVISPLVLLSSLTARETKDPAFKAGSFVFTQLYFFDFDYLYFSVSDL